LIKLTFFEKGLMFGHQQQCHPVSKLSNLSSCIENCFWMEHLLLFMEPQHGNTVAMGVTNMCESYWQKKSGTHQKCMNQVFLLFNGFLVENWQFFFCVAASREGKRWTL
jgi:hypothetical protein